MVGHGNVKLTLKLGVGLAQKFAGTAVVQGALAFG